MYDRQPTERYVLTTTFEVDLVVQATTWQRALWLGLQLVERESRIAFLEFSWRADGALEAIDAALGERYALTGDIFTKPLAA
jgi:hypothetical protein